MFPISEEMQQLAENIGCEIHLVAELVTKEKKRVVCSAESPDKPNGLEGCEA